MEPRRYRSPYQRVGFEPGVLKGVCPLHGVTGARGPSPLAGARRLPPRDFEYPPSPPQHKKQEDT